jgi:hypothetical protein
VCECVRACVCECVRTGACLCVCVCVCCAPAYVVLHYVAATGIPLLSPESPLPNTMVVNAPRPSTENKINCPLCRSRLSFLSRV